MNVSRAIKAGAHLKFGWRWLRYDGTNFVVTEIQPHDRSAVIVYSGKDLDAATAVLMSSQAQEAQNE